MPSRAFRVFCVIIACATIALPRHMAGAAGGDAPRGELFDNVVNILRKRFYDERARTQLLPALAERYHDPAHSATSLEAEREIVEQMLAHMPFSHLGLLSAAGHERMMHNLNGEAVPTFGCELTQIDGDYFVSGVLEGGPAEQAGLKRGDHVLRIDDDIPAHSPRLDWRSDDAALTDPPVHDLLCTAGEEVTLHIERTPGRETEISVVASPYAAYEAAKKSAEVLEIDGRKIAFVHFWFVHMRGMDSMLDRLVQNQFKDADALVLDLRGRGGSAPMVNSVLKVLAGRNSKWRRPIVALIDNQTRSAKEMMAYEIKTRKLGLLVGQRTAGALLPATFADVGADSVLMYPAFAMEKYTAAIEGKGVEADVEAESPLAYSAGADPIREAGMHAAATLAAKRAASTQPVH